MEQVRILFISQYAQGGARARLREQLEELDRCGIPARVILLVSEGNEGLAAEVAQRVDVCETEEQLERAIADFQPTIISTRKYPPITPNVPSGTIVTYSSTPQDY